MPEHGEPGPADQWWAPAAMSVKRRKLHLLTGVTEGDGAVRTMAALCGERRRWWQAEGDVSGEVGWCHLCAERAAGLESLALPGTARQAPGTAEQCRRLRLIVARYCVREFGDGAMARAQLRLMLDRLGLLGVTEYPES